MGDKSISDFWVDFHRLNKLSGIRSYQVEYVESRPGYVPFSNRVLKIPVWGLRLRGGESRDSVINSSEEKKERSAS